jgi:hypothetical protein
VEPPKQTKHVLKMIENVEEFLRALKKYGVKKTFLPRNDEILFSFFLSLISAFFVSMNADALVEPKSEKDTLDVFLALADLKRMVCLL